MTDKLAEHDAPYSGNFSQEDWRKDVATRNAGSLGVRGADTTDAALTAPKPTEDETTSDPSTLSAADVRATQLPGSNLVIENGNLIAIEEFGEEDD